MAYRFSEEQLCTRTMASVLKYSPRTKTSGIRFWTTKQKLQKKNECAFEDRAPICVDDVVNKL